MTTTEARTQARAKGGALPPGVYWRHRTLWIAYYVTGPDGRRVKHREPTDATSPREAGQLRATRIAEHAKGERTVESRTLTVAAVLAAVLTDYELNHRRSLDTARGRAKAIAAALGPDTRAVDVTTDRVQGMQRDWLRAGITPATVNRRCNLLRRGLRLLLRARRLPFVPDIPRLREPKRRGRYITPTDAEALRQYLPAYAATVFMLALVLATRRGQLSRTLRRYVDRDRRVIEWPPAECKADEPHTVPLVGDALKLVDQALAAAVPWCPFLLHGPDCRPGHRPSRRYGCVGDFKKAWATACRLAGLPVGRKAGGFVFHHTRNTAATNLRAGGLSEGDCMAIGGWKTRAVFDWYNLGDVEALRERLAAAQGATRTVVPLRRPA
jgi:hypothetical protein